tara:strand:+ start:1747 stop:2241 length:495 start_codon:yes stop_codon:yes gene_type:complete
MARDGYTPFVISCFGGELEKLAEMIKSPIDKDEVKYGIREASNAGQKPVIDFLLANFETIGFEDFHITTAFRNACRRKYIDITKTLFAFCQKKSLLTHDLLVTAFHGACERGFVVQVQFFLDLYDRCAFSREEISEGLYVARYAERHEVVALISKLDATRRVIG